MFLTNLCLSKTMLSNWYLVCNCEAVFVFEYINWFLVMLERRSRLANTLKISCKDAKVDVIYPDLSVAVFSAISVNWLVNVQWDTWIGRQHFLVLTMSVTWAELKWSLQTWEKILAVPTCDQQVAVWMFSCWNSAKWLLLHYSNMNCLDYCTLQFWFLGSEKQRIKVQKQARK